MKKKQEVRPHTFGLSLLLVVFLVLCLMTFAAISIAEARNDLTGSRKKFDKTAAYNAAVDIAELAIADYTESAAINPERAEKVIDYSVSIDETDQLNIRLVLDEEAEADHPRYQVTRWQVVSNVEWEANDTLEVLPGGELGW